MAKTQKKDREPRPRNRSLRGNGSASPRSFGHLIRLRPEYEERYIILHKHTFPGVLRRIRLSNIRNYSIFLREGVLFSYMEYVGADMKADMEALADETTREWWKLTDPMQEAVPERKREEWWASMECLFHGSTPGAAPGGGLLRRAYCAGVRTLGSESAAAWYSKAARQAGVQKAGVYALGGNLYVYCELPGGRRGKGAETLPGILMEHIQPGAVSSWEEMREVFHTP